MSKKKLPTAAEVGILMSIANFIAGWFKRSPEKKLSRAKRDHAARRLEYDKLVWDRISENGLDLEYHDIRMATWDIANPPPEMADFDPSVARRLPSYQADIVSKIAGSQVTNHKNPKHFGKSSE